MQYTTRLIGLLMPLSLAPSVLAQAGDTLRVATLNCEWMSRGGVHVKYGLPLRDRDWRPDDRAKWQDIGPREKAYTQACDRVAQLIVRIDADVIALSEVGPRADTETLHEAVQRAGLTYDHRVSGSCSWDQCVAVWSRRPLSDLIAPLPGQAIYNTELDDPQSERITGVSKSMHVVLEAGGVPIHLYNLHLKSENGGHESDAKRIAQAGIVRRHTLHYLQAPRTQADAQGYVIVAGDLNDRLGEPTLRRIRGRDDAGIDLVQPWHTEYYHDTSQWNERWSYNYKGAFECIDHVLPSLNLLEQLLPQDDEQDPRGISAVALAVTETMPDGSPVTDHKPLIVTLRFKAGR